MPHQNGMLLSVNLSTTFVDGFVDKWGALRIQLAQLLALINLLKS
jgi:hypothetical protein